MYILTAIGAILLIALSGTELVLDHFDADELSNMGIKEL